MLSELKIVDVRRRAILENKDEFVLAPVESAHAATLLDPHTNIACVAIDAGSGRKNLGKVPPVHAYVVNGAVDCIRGEV